MKFICLGYIDEKLLESMSESEVNAFMDKCFEYDEELIAKGHFVGGEALQGPRTGVSVKWREGEVQPIDGPFVETKEFLGGILILEAKDLEEAVAIMSKHPGVFHGGGFEVRPAADLSAYIEASRARRQVSKV